MLKSFAKNQRGEAVVIFLIGLVFTMVVSAKEITDLKAENEGLRASAEISLDIEK